jgi:hypothetical protein
MECIGESALAPTRVRQHTLPCITSKTWTPQEDFQLIRLVQSSMMPTNWAHISESFPTKTETQVAGRWAKVLDPSLLKGSWTRHEDETIIRYVAANGTKSWTKLSLLLPGRIGKQCRERWVNALDPSLDRGPWTPEEDDLLRELHERFGNHWTKIAEAIPNRSDNAVKNRWHSSLSKRRKTPLIEHPKTRLPSIALLPSPTFGCSSFEALPSPQSAPVIRRTVLPGGDLRLTDLVLSHLTSPHIPPLS